MKIVEGILSLTLAASAIVGMQILANDRWLWSAAPSHAYGLVGFVSIDIILLGATLERIRPATLGSVFIAGAQFVAMFADIVAGQPEGVPPIAFRNYLLTDTSYLGLLFIQVAILMVAVATLTTPILHRHGRLIAFLHQRPN